jgi:autotransporter-associated beta strand protein
MALAFFTAGTAQATDLYSSGAKTWNTSTANWGTGSGGPYTAATWNNTTPDSATFEGSVGTVTLGEDITVSNMLFTVASTGYTITGGTLNFVAGGSIRAMNNTVNQTIQSAITGSPVVRVNRGPSGGAYEGLIFAPNSGTQTLGAIYVPDNLGGTADKAGVYLSGSTTGNSAASVSCPGGIYGTLYKDGSGTWTVGNVDVGAIRINGGTLVANGYLRYYYAGVFVNSGGALHYNNPGAVYSGFTLNGGSLDNSSGAAITNSTYNPGQAWAGDWTFIGSNGTNSDLNLGTGGVTLSATRTVTVSNALTTLTIGGAIGDGASIFGVTKAGDGTLWLKAANTYNGPTTVTAGTLKLGNGTANTALDNTAVVSVAAGATLNLNFTVTDDVFYLFLGGSGAAAGTWGRIGHLTAANTSALLTGDGLINNLGGLAPAGTWYWDGGNVNIVTDGDGFGTGGAGIWSTSVANWDQGFTSHKVWNNTTNDKAIFRTTAGTVDLQSDITLGEILIDGVDNYTIGSNPETQSLNFGGAKVITVSQVIATIRAGITGSPQLKVLGSSADPAYLYPDVVSMTLGNVTVGDNAVGNNPELYLAGSTTGNSIANVTSPNTWSRIFKQGTGTWTLGNVGIGGFNLSAGTLVINGTYTPTSTGFQTFTGGTLAGTGTLNSAITVPAAGTIAPGNPTGTLTITNNACIINGKLAVTVNGASCSKLAVVNNNSLTITNATLQVTVGSTPSSAVVIASYGSLVGAGTFKTITGMPASWAVDYNYKSNKEIALIPPPSGTIILFR